MHSKEEKMAAFGRLLDIIDELREKCPWDRKQTNESLRPNTIEETYELCEALTKNDDQEICKELGDVLMHVCFYAKFGDEKGLFDIKDVCDRLCDKLIYRHPHIYGDAVAENVGQVLQNWEQLKIKEKGGNKMVLSGVPASLPTLIKAYRIQDKARNVGFDWEDASGAWQKVKEEIAEFEEASKKMTKEEAEAEFGDVMFSLINAARLLHINPDNALEHTNQKFIRRFNYVEEHSIKQGCNLKDMTLEEMDALWEEAKSKMPTQTMIQFDAQIEPVPEKGGAFVRFPYDIKQMFGKGRLKVHATFDGIPYDGSIVNMGVKNRDGSVCYILGMLKEIRKQLNKQPGDMVHVTISIIE